MTRWAEKDVVVTVNGKHPPAAGAKRMTIKGVVQLVQGIGLRSGQKKGFVLKKGSKLKAGPYTFVVDKVETSQDVMGFDGLVDVYSVTMKFHHRKQLKTVDFIKELKFFDAGGKEIGSSMKSFMGTFEGGGEHTLTWLIKKTSTAKYVVKWTVFAKVVEFKVPLRHSGPIERK